MPAPCLQAHLPEALQLVEVTGGYAVLRCSGLYEVQLSLQQLPYPVQVAEARQAAKEAAVAAAGSGEAGQAGTTQQLQEKQAAQQQPVASAAADAAAPEVRWQWKLTHLVVLPNAGNRQPLQPEQLLSLTHHLQANMWAAADAAAVEAAKQQGAAEGGQPQPLAAAAAGAAVKGTTPPPAAAAQPAASGMLSTRSGPAASTLSGLSGVQGDAAGRGLQLELYGSDEISLPLRLMHAVLRDVAARILLREVEAAAGQLAGAGSKWHTHLRLVKPDTLKPGVCLLYWQQAPALLALPDPVAEAAAEAGGADGAAAAAGAASKPSQAGKAADVYPAIEVGTGSDGTIQQLHVPPLRLQSRQQQQQLLLRPSLDTHTVDIVGLLLQGVQVLVANQLVYLHDAMQRRWQQEAAAGKGQLEADAMLQLRLARYGHLRSSAAAQQQHGRQLVLRSPSTSAAAAAGPLDAFSDDQQQQQAVLQQLPDTLEVLVGGQAAVTVSFQPWSGRLILRPGSAYGGDCNIEFGMSLHQVSRVGVKDRFTDRGLACAQDSRRAAARGLVLLKRVQVSM